MHMYSNQMKKHARQLRQQGLTYTEICRKLKLKIPKATLNYWVRGVPLPNWYRSKLNKLWKLNIGKAQEKNRILLINRLNQIRLRNANLLEKIDADTGKLLLATLYWCEGAKYPSHRNIRFGSSDSRMIDVFLTLIRTCYVVDESKFRLTIQCRADQNLRNLTLYWHRITRIPFQQHYLPRIDSRSIGKPTNKKDYKGVCVIDYFDADLLCELQYAGELLGSPNSIARMKKITR